MSHQLGAIISNVTKLLLLGGAKYQGVHIFLESLQSEHYHIISLINFI